MAMWTLVQSQANTRTRRQDAASSGRREAGAAEPAPPGQRSSVRFKTLARLALLGPGADADAPRASAGPAGAPEAAMAPAPARQAQGPGAFLRRQSIGAQSLPAASPLTPAPGGGSPEGAAAQARSPLGRAPSVRQHDGALRDWGAAFQRGRNSFAARTASDGRSSISSGTPDAGLAAGWAPSPPGPGRFSVPVSSSLGRGAIQIVIGGPSAPEEEREEEGRASASSAEGRQTLHPIAEASPGGRGRRLEYGGREGSGARLHEEENEEGRNSRRAGAGRGAGATAAPVAEGSVSSLH